MFQCYQEDRIHTITISKPENHRSLKINESHSQIRKMMKNMLNLVFNPQVS